MAAEEGEVAKTETPPAPAEEALVKEPEAAAEAKKEEVLEKPKEEAAAEEKQPEEKIEEKPKASTKEDVEKKALQEFKLKIEEALKGNQFVLPPPPPAAKKDEEAKAEAATTPDQKEDVIKTEAAAAPEPVVAAAEEEPKELPISTAPVAEPVAEPLAAENEAAKAEEPPAAEAEAIPPEDVLLWGIPLLHSKCDERTDVILSKFLRARDFKVSQALTMLKNTVLWRKSYKTDEILEEDLGTDFDGFAFMFGADKQGHPVCYNVFGALQDKDFYHKALADEASAAKFIRWRVQLQEKGIKLLKFEPGTPNALFQVIDLKNSPWPAKKDVRGVLGQAISLLQDNYPELVVKNVFINAPWYYSAIYAVISPFLTQRQKNKFVVARLGKSTEALFKFISPENVPLQYGGFGRADDNEFSGAEAPPTEITVKAGEKKTLDLPVTTSGATVTWDLNVVGSDVSYAAEFQPDQEGGYTTIIEKTKKIASQEEIIRNCFKTSEPGKVVLTIDNSLSRKKKLVLYRHIVKGSPGIVAELDA